MADDEVSAGEEDSHALRSQGAGEGTASLARRLSTQLQVGDVLEADSGCRYEILERLGRGGMAEVYRAQGVRPTGFTSDVALKGLLEGLEDRESSARQFRHEAEVSGYLNHPNIARALDLERIQGRLYLVLEYVDGVSLRAVMHAMTERKTAMPPEFACYVCAAIAEALSYAHSLTGRDGNALGIIHRDVSPTNVMVTRKGIPKLLDFGIAFARVPNRDRTATGVVLGTYSYLSPEQAASGQAARGEVDGRSDLFSLGLVLVELLTGRKVFRAEDEYLTAKNRS
jgi:eukaryotic-like serine/threonine-protein kinase